LILGKSLFPQDIRLAHALNTDTTETKTLLLIAVKTILEFPAATMRTTNPTLLEKLPLFGAPFLHQSNKRQIMPFADLANRFRGNKTKESQLLDSQALFHFPSEPSHIYLIFRFPLLYLPPPDSELFVQLSQSFFCQRETQPNLFQTQVMSSAKFQNTPVFSFLRWREFIPTTAVKVTTVSKMITKLLTPTSDSPYAVSHA
jgi:hypothetical protein